MHSLDDDAFVAEVNRRYDSIPSEISRHRDVMELLLPVLRADMKAVEQYAYSPSAPLTCPIRVFGGDADPRASLPQLQAWQQHTTQPLTVRRFDGGHFFLTDPVVAQAVVADLSASLRSVLADIS